MAHHHYEDIVKPQVNPGAWYYEKNINKFMKEFGVEKLLKLVPILEIEKYLRKEKLKNIKS
jgi:hypothetical protein